MKKSGTSQILLYSAFPLWLVASIFNSRHVELPDADASNYQASVIINNPSDDETYNKQDVLDLKVTFENNDEIKNIDVSILNTTTGDTMYHISKNTKSELYYFVNNEIELNSFPPGDYILKAATWDRKTPDAVITETAAFKIK